jgi:microcystin degradation protein MlrC
MLAVGGKVDDRHGPTLVLDAEIVRVADVRYRRTGTYMTGQQVDLGRCAVVAVEGVELVLTSRRAMPFDPDHLPAVGIDPAERRVLVAKSAIAWRAAFGAVARGVVYVDGPGICTCSLGRLPFTSRPRPAWPLEPATFSAAAG